MSIVSVEEVAEMLGLTKQGAHEWSGPNPSGQGATTDGYILFDDGNAYDRKISRKYSPPEVAKLAGIKPEEYAPFQSFIAQNPTYTNNGNNGVASGHSNGHSTAQRAIIREIEGIPVPVMSGTLMSNNNGHHLTEPKTYNTKSLKERGFTESTISHFEIQDEDDYYQYPTLDEYGKKGCPRHKFKDPVAAGHKYNTKTGKPIKYRWQPYNKHQKGVVYNLHSIVGDEVYLVGGEPDVWSCHQVGIPAICCFGESRNIEKAIALAAAKGIIRLYCILDSDETGWRASARVMDACIQHDIECIVKNIKAQGCHDINDLFNSLNFNKDLCRNVIDSLPLASKEELEYEVQEARKIEEVKEEVASRKVRSTGEGVPAMIEYLEDHPKFYTEDDEFYVIFTNKRGAKVPLRVGEEKFLAKIMDIFITINNKPPTKDAIEAMTLVMKSRAMEERRQKTWIRTGKFEDKFYIDLGNDDYQVVEISKEGWSIQGESPIFFRRPGGLHAMPIPKRGGDVRMLRSIVNARDESIWMMMLSWLIFSLTPPEYPYPVLAVSGQQGSAKSTTCKMLRELIDPNFTKLMSSSMKSDQDVVIAARNSHALGFDNVSSLPKWMSDLLCQLVTDGSYRCRKLFTDGSEMLFNRRCPIVLNGMEALMGRADLVDRSLVCQLDRIDATQRKGEAELWKEFHRIAPYILGWIFDCLVGMLQYIDRITTNNLPRMADFAKAIMACEMAGVVPWKEGEFLVGYGGNIKEARVMGIEESSLAMALIEYMTTKHPGSFWEGTASDLWDVLNRNVDAETRHMKDFPATFRQLGVELTRCAPSLGEAGVYVEKCSVGSGANTKRWIKILVDKDVVKERVKTEEMAEVADDN